MTGDKNKLNLSERMKTMKKYRETGTGKTVDKFAVGMMLLYDEFVHFLRPFLPIMHKKTKKISFVPHCGTKWGYISRESCDIPIGLRGN